MPEKKSRSANNYLWALLGKMSEALSVTAEYLYKQYIRQCRIGYTVIEVEPGSLPTLAKAWTAKGTGWDCERTGVTADGKAVCYLYYGSSCYTQKELSRLIDAVKADCNELGIQTISDEELDAMLHITKPKTENKDGQRNRNICRENS